MPLTSLMTLLGGLSMLGSWFFIGYRMKHSSHPVSQQVRLLRGYFLYMSIFCFIMFMPHLLLGTDPDRFSSAMAWGYVVGHIFCYIAFTIMLRLTFSMVPRLANKEAYAIAFGTIFIVAVTLINAKTMIYGTQPTYDLQNHVTLFNAAPVVGASIALFASVCVVPAAILFIINGIHNPSARLRSLLLGGGMFVTMVAGPMHDVARSWQLYMAADIISILGILLVTAGVVYRLEERIAPRVAATHHA